MQKFACDQCGQQVFFQNDLCESCAAPLAFDTSQLRIAALAPRDQGYVIQHAGNWLVWRCANYETGGCNWLAYEAGGFCAACRHNRTIPDLNIAANVPRWRSFEAAKRRLFYGLLRFGLPLKTRAEDASHGLAFDCIGDETQPNGDRRRVMTGHDNGIITIALSEADSAQREKARVALGEAHRTLLGHFRHEIGHYYWDVLVAAVPQRLARFRALFGDERSDYGEALSRHYRDGPPHDWPTHFITPYASSHPWEDFAESWQHYMHIVDALETASAMSVAVDHARQGAVGTNPYEERDAKALALAWTPLTIALNSMNRSMGLPDLYPFVLTAPAIEKLSFVGEIIGAQRGR